MPLLAKYLQKRDFQRTREPRGSAKKLPKKGQALSFVVQKHDARSLHYDFRLELDGVLLSWAVPKGPSRDPSVKRLAMEVEPHPLEYGGFEGTIPKGEYGGGTVMVWDRGTWSCDGDPHQALDKGHLSFSLSGQKLKGAWHLVRTKGVADDQHGNKEGKGWLLFKSRDEHARDNDNLLSDEPDSAATGRNLDQIAHAEGGGEDAPDSRPRRRRPPMKAEKTSAKQPSRVSPEATRQPDEPRQPRKRPKLSSVANKPKYVVTHPDKVLYPEMGITKQEMLEYYALVAERMLPHVANRPLTLVRCPNGEGKPCFFQKHPGRGTPPGLRSVSIREKEGKSPYSVIDDATGLFGLVQLGALEIHTWGSRADDFEHPDILVFDLDPDPLLDYAAVIAGAHAIREVFEQAKLQSFVKTTGGKGLHVCVPIAPELGWEPVKAFTGYVAQALARRSPELYVATQSKARRIGKTFIDYLRNARGATFIAPYSTRARENAPIAIPLEWDELSPKLLPNHFNLRNVRRRLEKLKHDPFESMLGLAQRLPTEGIERLGRDPGRRKPRLRT